MTLDAVLGATSILSVLVLAVLAVLLRKRISSKRQLALTATFEIAVANAAVRLACAGSPDLLSQELVDGVVALAASPSSWTAFMVLQDNAPFLMAVAGPAPIEAGARANAALVADWNWQFRVEAPGPERPPSGHLVIPVRVSGEIRGALVVGPSDAGSDALFKAFLRLCRQTEDALHRFESTQARMDRNERKFSSLVRNSCDSMTLLGRDGVILYQSAGGRSVLGLEANGLLGQTFVPLTHPEDAAHTRDKFIEVLHGAPGASVHLESRLRHADGSWRLLETILTNMLDDPDVHAVVSNSRDITERRALEQQLSHQAFHDSLTGLANRALFLDRVTHALDRADRHASPVAVLFVDIDDFKTVNDSLGHHHGDDVLIAVAELLKHSVRPGDTVARLGGDEFAVLLDTGQMPQAAEVVARRIASALFDPIEIGGENITVRASIGIALGQPPVDQPGGLMRDADLAMYMAKRNGKGRFEMFRPEMHEEAVRRLETAADLRRGIADSQFEVYYQPIIDTRNATIIGAEALVRWHHPTRGLVRPGEFIPSAESTGLILPLGKWVLGDSCRQVQAWRRAGVVDDNFYISVNLSARQLQDASLLDDVSEALETSGLPAAMVVLEVTESVIINDLVNARSRLEALKLLGFRLAVDDFGTGYSSLSQLRNFPMDIVKLDKSFVDQITLDHDGTAMVRGLIDLCVALGLTTIAEGVEHEEQLVLLHQLGCDNVQGYLFAQPMPGAEFAQFLRDSTKVPISLSGSAAWSGFDDGQPQAPKGDWCCTPAPSAARASKSVHTLSAL